MPFNPANAGGSGSGPGSFSACVSAGSGGNWERALSLLRAVFEQVGDYALFVLDLNGQVLTWSSAAQRLTGYGSEEMIGAPLSKLSAAAGAAASTATAGPVEGWHVRKDGKPFWAEFCLSTLQDDAGQACGVLVLLRELTERRRQEERLHQSEQQLRLFVDSVTDYAIFTLDPKGNVTSWNSGARQIKGYEASEIIGKHFSRFYPPEAIARRWPEYELRMATLEGHVEDEGWRLRKDGTRFWANVVITALRDAQGNLHGFGKVTRDLSERRRQEENLRRSEQRFRLLVEGVREHALFLVDAQGVVSSWNEGAKRIEGYRPDQIIGRHIANFYLPEDVAIDQPWRDLTTARSAGRLEREGWWMRSDGSSYRARMVANALRNESGELYGYALLLQDLTQQAHAEALENIVNKVNEFIALLAHELRNPLAPIRNAVMLMARKGLGDPVLEAMRQTIDRQSLHLERVVDELLDVSRIARGQLSVEKTPLDLLQVVARAIETSQPIIERRRHELHVLLPDRPVPMSGDALRLTQLVVNLLNNAAKYTPRGGQIWLKVMPRDQQVQLSVRDTGIGIRADMLERIFDLFTQDTETLQFTEGGLGVGLALVRRIVELHGGRVEVHSEGRDKGTEFVVTLPADDVKPGSEPFERQPLPAEWQAPPVEPHGQGDEALRRHKILVADDNVDAAASLELLLQSYGQETIVAHDGAEALEAAARFHPDIVMLDIGMPKLNGYEVAQQLRRASPSSLAPILVAITGWGQEGDKQRAVQVGFDHHFVKPLNDEALRALLRS